MVDYMKQKPDWKKSIVDEDWSEAEKKFGRSLDGRLSDVTYEAVLDQALEAGNVGTPDYINQKPDWKKSIVDEDWSEAEKKFGRSLDGRLSDVTYEAVRDQALEAGNVGTPDYINQKPDWKKSIVDEDWSEAEKKFGRSLDGKLSDVTYEAVRDQALASKKEAIEANKKAYAEDMILMQEIQKNEEKDAKESSLFWRKGKLDSNDLGDFIREDIMTGPYASRKERETMPAMVDINQKTQGMYQRYFDAKNSEKGLDSDPVVKKWVENGDKKAKAIYNGNSSSHSSNKGYDEKAHMMHMHGQRGR